MRRTSSTAFSSPILKEVYGLAVFFVLAHLLSGLRIIMLTHGVRKTIADLVMIGGTVAAGATLVLSLADTDAITCP